MDREPDVLCWRSPLAPKRRRFNPSADSVERQRVEVSADYTDYADFFRDWPEECLETSCHRAAAAVSIRDNAVFVLTG
jgi:hypothetical protein